MIHIVSTLKGVKAQRCNLPKLFEVDRAAAADVVRDVGVVVNPIRNQMNCCSRIFYDEFNVIHRILT